jgi:hypothetical protein
MAMRVITGLAAVQMASLLMVLSLLKVRLRLMVILLWFK